MIASESTVFTLDRTERFSFNALQEALDIPAQTMPDGGAALIGNVIRAQRSDASH